MRGELVVLIIDQHVIGPTQGNKLFWISSDFLSNHFLQQLPSLPVLLLFFLSVFLPPHLLILHPTSLLISFTLLPSFLLFMVVSFLPCLLCASSSSSHCPLLSAPPPPPQCPGQDPEEWV